jgi:hypothetical protein
MAAPSIGPHLFDRLVNRQRKLFVFIQIAEERTLAGRVQLLRNIIVVPGLHSPGKFADAFQVLFVGNRLCLARRDDLIEKRWSAPVTTADATSPTSSFLTF